MAQLYRRLDEKIRDLSRAQYAVLTGVLTTVALLVVDILLREPSVENAVIMGLSMTIVYYWFNPDDKI